MRSFPPISRIRSAALALAVLLGACAQGDSVPPLLFAERDYAPSPDRFRHCSNTGCKVEIWTGMSAEEWAQVGAVFNADPPADALAERQRISRAIGLIETIIAERTDTAGLPGIQDPGFSFVASRHLDCIDNAHNTMTFLHMIQQEGWLRYHREAGAELRGCCLIDGYQHFTASILETATDTVYVVDTWFFTTGVPAVVVPYSKWFWWYFPAETEVL